MSIKLKSIFQKKIDREINGVIKAGDSNEYNLKQELEEFVITDEIKKHLDKFFEAYEKGINGVTDKNAVWISGFFGSGKSHFLKILSCVLKNEEICGKKVLAYFKGKGLKKSTLDNMKAAEKVSTDVILFNIAAKVEEAKEQEAIIRVFNMAFNEMKGLCGSKPWIAALEEKLIQEKVYETFKNSFEEFSGKCWEEGRENFYFEKDSVIKALIRSADISEASARTWCEKCEEDFNLNIENFAAKVREYCENKGENHHVVFLVDEIGQYMGKDTKLLLNLQTVVEELAVKCQGKCWVIVTAQEELSSFVDENNKDFSKILGRFNTKISLSSTNADEVIKERLLKKNKKSAIYLKEYYEENESNIKNLIIFPKESGLKGYKDINDFAGTYPFVDYQFNMLQRMLNGIRTNGTAGKDISKGERSLLEAYQNAAINFMREEIGTVIPLYGFYGVVENYLNPSIKEIIVEAEKNKAISEFALKVLKTLFLIKYENTLEADGDNIASLMISNLRDSKKEVQEKTKDALASLVEEGFVEKSGKGYVFLTKEEQLINKEISEISVEKEDVNKKIGEIIFERIYKSQKYTYSQEYKFDFNKFIDNFIIGNRKSEIGVRIVTSDFDLKGDEVSELKRISLLEKEVIVDISQSIACIEAVERFLKIDFYLRKKWGGRDSELFQTSAFRKIKEKDEISTEAEELLKEALKKARIFVSGNLLQGGEKNGVDKINEGFLSLITTEYFKLTYVKRFRNEIQDLQKILSEDKVELGNSAGDLALEEVRGFIEGSSLRGKVVTLNDVLLRFSKMPYGWKKIDIKGIVLELIVDKQIKAFVEEESFNYNRTDINDFIINKKSENEIYFKPRVKISLKYIEALKDIAKELFNTALDNVDSEKAMLDFKELCKEELNVIKHMLYEFHNGSGYPGKNTLDLGQEIILDILDQKEEFKFYKEVYDLQDDFEEYMDEIEEVKGFYFRRSFEEINVLEKGEQRIIFDKAVEAVKNYNDDEDFVESEEVHEIMVKIKHILFNRKPYLDIPKIPELLKEYHHKMKPLIEAEVQRVVAYSERCKKELSELMDNEAMKSEVVEAYGKLIFKIEGEASFMKLAALEKLVERKTGFYKKQLIQ